MLKGYTVYATYIGIISHPGTMESPVLHGEILNFDERVKNNGKTQVLSILFQKEAYNNLIGKVDLSTRKKMWI